MEIVRKIPDSISFIDLVKGEQRVPIRYTPYFVSSIEEFVKTGQMSVCIHHTVPDYKYQILGNKYYEISPIDTVGNIISFNNDTMEVIISIDDSYFEDSNSKYIDKNKLDLYDLSLRSIQSVHHDINDGSLYATIDRLIGFDLILGGKK